MDLFTQMERVKLRFIAAYERLLEEGQISASEICPSSKSRS